MNDLRENMALPARRHAKQRPELCRAKTRNLYSFASKYCSHHFPDSFPIYDYFVETMLLHYAGEDAFSAFTRADLKRYPRFGPMETK